MASYSFAVRKANLIRDQLEHVRKASKHTLFPYSAATNADPAESLNLVPYVGMMYDATPCPATAVNCQQGAAPLAGVDKFYTITNYWMGGTFAIYAGTSLNNDLSGWGLPPSGQGFIMVDAKIYALPMAVGTPTLTSVDGGPAAGGEVTFTTSDGEQGSLNLATGLTSLSS